MCRRCARDSTRSGTAGRGRRTTRRRHTTASSATRMPGPSWRTTRASTMTTWVRRRSECLAPASKPAREVPVKPREPGESRASAQGRSPKTQKRRRNTMATTYEGWTIRTGFLAGNLFAEGGDDRGVYDVDASAARYAEMCREALEKEFP